MKKAFLQHRYGGGKRNNSKNIRKEKRMNNEEEQHTCNKRKLHPMPQIWDFQASNQGQS